MPVFDIASLQAGYLNGISLTQVIRNGVVVWESEPTTLPDPVELVVSSNPLPAPAFPISVRADGRGFQGADGDPFYGVGDTSWNLISRMTNAEVTEYAAARRAQGYTLVQVSLLDINSKSRTQVTTGVTPFAGVNEAADFSRPNQVYFDAAKAKLDILRAAGLYVGLVPGWYGYAGNKWRSNWGTNPADTSKAVTYANYLAAQFGARDHVYWIHGGDCAPDTSGIAVQDSPVKIDLTTITNAFASTLDSAASANQLHTYHTGRGQNARDKFPTASWMHINAAYAGVDVPAETTVEWARGDRPVIMIEGYYDKRGVVSGVTTFHMTPAQLRATAWHSVVTGAFLHVNGNEFVWPVRDYYTGAAWNDAVHGVAAVSAGHLRVLSRVLASFPTKVFLPDASSGALVTTGRGSGVTLTAGLMSTDRLAAIVYVPAAKTFTVDLTRFARMPKLGWVNPETGALTALPMPTGTTATLTTPSGWADAVLVCVS